MRSGYNPLKNAILRRFARTPRHDRGNASIKIDYLPVALALFASAAANRDTPCHGIDPPHNIVVGGKVAHLMCRRCIPFENSGPVRSLKAECMIPFGIGRNWNPVEPLGLNAVGTTCAA